MSLIDRQDLFDTLTVRLAEPQPRADVLRLLGKAALAIVVLGAWPRSGLAQEVTEESNLVKGCRLPGQKCRKNKDCCSSKCRGGAGRARPALYPNTSRVRHAFRVKEAKY